MKALLRQDERDMVVKDENQFCLDTPPDLFQCSEWTPCLFFFVPYHEAVQLRQLKTAGMLHVCTRNMRILP